VVFNGSGYLIELHDSSGSNLTVNRDVNGRIAYVGSAADGLPGVGENRLYFTYYASGPDAGRLLRITDPINRSWMFEYASGQLWPVNYPSGGGVDPSFLELAYDASNRISDITSRDTKTWTYAYTSGKLTTVSDPTYQGGRYTQTFAYGSTPVGGLWETTYTNRRSYHWVIRFDTLGNARELTNPLPVPPEQKTRRWEWGADHGKIGTVTYFRREQDGGREVPVRQPRPAYSRDARRQRLHDGL